MRRRSARQRTLALAALFGALASPATALAHGFAHSHLASGHHAHDTSFDGGVRVEPSVEQLPEIGAPDADEGPHDHPTLHCRVCATRSATSIVVVLATTALTVVVVAEAAAPVAIESSSAPAFHARPPDQSRAPPNG